MKKLIYKLLIYLLTLAGISNTYAQGDINPGEGGPGDDTSMACKCYLPYVAISNPYGCNNIPVGPTSQCTNINMNLENPNYFEDWYGNRGPVCGKNFVAITDRYNFSPIQKSHAGLFDIMDNTTYAVDPHAGFPTRSPLGGNQAVRIGDDIASAYGVSFATTVRVEQSNPYITLLYAFVMSICSDPHNEAIFAIRIYNKSNGCSRVVNLQFEMSNANNIAGLKYTPDHQFGYKEWTSQVLNMKNFFSTLAVASEDFTIEFVAMDCAYCVHRAYGYVDATCGNNVIITQPDPDPDPEDPDPEPDPVDPFKGIIKCTGANIAFSTMGGSFLNETYLWDFGDGKGWSAEKEPIYFYSAPGIYNATLKISGPGGTYDMTDTIKVKIIDCCSLENVPKIKSEDCITTFSPVEGETYVLHAWVKEDVSDPNTDSRIITYAKGTPHIGLTFYNESDGSPVYESCFPSGPIIDGWQRIEKEFTIPSCPSNGKINMDITLNGLANDIDEGTYFDDIRIFPKKGGMKSFVYDPASQKLLAELDEENFATFYEYDQEGALIRVKKETERGIKTLKEAGNNTKKP